MTVKDNECDLKGNEKVSEKSFTLCVEQTASYLYEVMSSDLIQVLFAADLCSFAL